MKRYFNGKRLVIEADEGMMLTDGAELFASEYAFPEGVTKNETIREIPLEEYEAILAAQEAAELPPV